ncbi:hypothetical protein RHMOL_Rhmol02G0117800 [Rhododendron molle]|uniref:Uncharacterized protein n=1 Tax=Rhododendron molle TaxID=49168 RepID=A0ACC0PQP9_RHOML|nr:hypothetical protein RHMOL_Rhmol02G0117800 [Rhododendron molle]
MSRLNVHELLKHKKVAEPTAKSIARIPPPAAQQENPGEMAVGQFNSGCSRKMKREVNTPGGGERGNDKTTGVEIGIPLEDILHTRERMRLEEAAKNLNDRRSNCREYGTLRWLPHKLVSQSLPIETFAVVDQERIPQLNSDMMPCDQTLAVTVDTKGSVVNEIWPLQFLTTTRQESPVEDFGNDEVEAVGMGGEQTGEGEMGDVQLNSVCLEKEKRKVKTPRGDERGNKEKTGVRIGIPLEDILQTKGMSLQDAAINLNVSRSTLKRVCRTYDISRWPPRMKNEHVSQSCPKESPTVVDQEGIQRLNCDILPSYQDLAVIVDTDSVVFKARCVDGMIVKFRLSRPWKMA